MENSAHTHAPLGETAGCEPRTLVPTHAPRPGRGCPLRAGPRPIAPASLPQPNPTALRPGRGAPIWGEEITRLSATRSFPPPKPRSARTQGARLPPRPRPRPSHPRTGAVRGSGAEEGVSALGSPPHAPYRGFLDPFCPPRRCAPPTPSAPGPRGPQVSATAAYLSRRRGERGAGSAGLSAGWAPRGAGTASPCQRPRRCPSLRGLQGPGRGDTPLAGSARLRPAPSAPTTRRRRSQWPWGASAQPLGLRGSNLRAGDLPSASAAAPAGTGTVGETGSGPPPRCAPGPEPPGARLSRGGAQRGAPEALPFRSSDQTPATPPARPGARDRPEMGARGAVWILDSIPDPGNGRGPRTWPGAGCEEAVGRGPSLIFLPFRLPFARLSAEAKFSR